MKVILVNGSPHEKGCTYTALSEIASILKEEGLESEIFQIGMAPVSGCTACRGCARDRKCVMNGRVNEFLELAKTADGFIFGSPVHYAAASGSITSFLDCAFYAGEKSLFAHKPGAAIVSARRGGTTAAFEQLNKYFTISNMPVISSCYWNMVHGSCPEEVKKDLEGMQIMRALGRNMAWFLKCKEAGQKAGVPLPKQEDRVFTNFIRE